ncbi:hypothetical protein N7523_000605 [Penicillium sp. IBT 18751x]|nr:hypothetical protein N7523_000605 [Penicillium sp. IBT 18751x]
MTCRGWKVPKWNLATANFTCHGVQWLSKSPRIWHLTSNLELVCPGDGTRAMTVLARSRYSVSLLQRVPVSRTRQSGLIDLVPWVLPEKPYLITLIPRKFPISGGGQIG